MLDGKVVIVTGAARGIGQEYARACASAGLQERTGSPSPMPCARIASPLAFRSGRA